MSEEESKKVLEHSGSGEVYDGDMNFRNRDDGQMAASYTEISYQSQFTPNYMKSIDNADSSDGLNEDLSANGNKNDAADRESDFEGARGNDKHPKRPVSLMCDKAFPYELDGTVRREGEMTHFVAENLEYKLKLSSPITKRDISQANTSSKNSTPSTSAGLLPRHFLQSHLAQIDSNVLSDIEIDAQYLAASVDNLTENLYNLLRSISSITADNVEIHKNSVNKLTDNMDANIKCMYTIMAKTEEISKSMKPTEQLAVRIREIKRLVDMLENNL